MKKAVEALLALFFVILAVSGAIAAEKKNKSEIKTLENYIAIFDFDVKTGDKGISSPLTDNVIHELSQSDKYEVIDRGNMNKILKEQKLQMSGCVSGGCIVQAGQLLGVGKIVTGSVGIVGTTYYLTLQLINVETGKIEISVADRCKCELDELLDSTTRLAKRLLGEKVEELVAAALAPATVAIPKPPEPVAAAIAKPAEPKPKNTESIGMKFVYINPGTFTMGSLSGNFFGIGGESGRDGNEKQHQVTLTKGFYMQTTEVTQG